MVNGKVLTCEEFKLGAMRRMARCDALPSPEYRALCNEFNLHAGDVGTLAERGTPPERIREMAERKLGRR